MESAPQGPPKGGGECLLEVYCYPSGSFKHTLLPSLEVLGVFILFLPEKQSKTKQNPKNQKQQKTPTTKQPLSEQINPL